MRRLAWIGLLVLIVVAWMYCRGKTPPCVPALAWHSPPPHYDYFQSIELRRDGTGELAMGEGQLVRSDVKIRYRVDKGAIAIRYVAGSRAAARTIPITIDEGDFVVVEPEYDRTREHHYRCRLRFAQNPFPPDAVSDDHRIYYACER
jgi:hypothetical protein